MSKKRTYGVVCGMSDQGKSYLMKNYIIPELAKRKPVIVLDIMNEYTGINYAGFDGFINRLTEEKILGQAVHVIPWKTSRDAINTIKFVRALEEPVSLVIEEAHSLFNDSDLKKAVKKPLTEITMYGRHYNIDTILVSQRPANLSTNVRSQAEFMTFFKLKDPADVEFARKRSPEAGEKVDSLQKKFFFTDGNTPKFLNKLKPNQVNKL